MPDEASLIATIAVGLSAAFIGGLVAAKLRLPTIVGYLLAGMAVGPFTPGFVADLELAPQLAEIGVILLMFGVGIHFSIPDLLAVQKVALPGGIGQTVIATGLGTGLGVALGWTVGEGIVFGLALSVASTVVLLRVLTQRGALEEEAGRVAVGWSLVQDVVMVVVLVLLPVLAVPLGGESPGGSEGELLPSLLLTLGKLIVFIVIMLVAGVRVVPWLLARAEQIGSRELFILAVLAIALGIAYGASKLFGVSVALGAFLAGVVVNESELSHRAAEQALPLQEAFAVLFFVSVGMLIDPHFLITNLDKELIVLAAIVVGKSLAAIGIVLALGRPRRVAIVVGAGLSQIGEFSFIIAEVGRSLDLLPEEGHNLILVGALLSITINPLLFRAIDRKERDLSIDGRGREL